MIRAFVAVELPPPVRAYLRAVSSELRKRGLNGRFVRPESVHLTLKFLGDIEERAVEPIAARIEDCCRQVQPFDAEAGGLGVSPGLHRPRVVWVGLKAGDALSRLQSCIEAGLAEEGFKPAKRPFRPHLTLLRLKSQKNVSELARLCGRPPGGRPCFRVDEVQLMRSILKPDGAT